MIQLWARDVQDKWHMLGFYSSLRDAEEAWNTLWGNQGNYYDPKYIAAVKMK